MTHRARRTWLLIAILGFAAALCIAWFLVRKNRTRAPASAAILTEFGAYSPMDIDGEVYFPIVGDGTLDFETARHAQAAVGTPYVMSDLGTAALPEDYMQRLYTAFGKLAYSVDMFHDYDRFYLLVAEENGLQTVCGVIIRHNERFYLGDRNHELNDELLYDFIGAIASLGDR